MPGVGCCLELVLWPVADFGLAALTPSAGLHSYLRGTLRPHRRLPSQHLLTCGLDQSLRPSWAWPRVLGSGIHMSPF